MNDKLSPLAKKAEHRLKATIDLLRSKEHHNQGCYFDLINHLCAYLYLTKKEVYFSNEILAINKLHREAQLEHAFGEDGSLKVMKFSRVGYWWKRFVMKFRKD